VVFYRVNLFPDVEPCQPVKALTYLDLGPPVPARTLDYELSPLGTVTGKAPGFIMSATATHFLHNIFYKCIPPFPLWLLLLLPLSRHVLYGFLLLLPLSGVQSINGLT